MLQSLRWQRPANENFIQRIFGKRRAALRDLLSLPLRTIQAGLESWHLFQAIERYPARKRRDRLIFAIANLFVCVKAADLLRRYERIVGRIPNVAQPSRFSELVQWRKLFDRNPLFPVFSDKLRAREWARQRCPDLASPPVLWVGLLPAEIPEQYLTAKCVIKTNHNSGQNYFPHRDHLPRAEVEAKFEDWMGYSFAKSLFEWGYAPVERKIFVEDFISTEAPLMDLGIRVHNDEISTITIATHFKTPQYKYASFFADGSRCRIKGQTIPEDHRLPDDFEVPANFRAAVEYAKALGAGLDHVRVDFLSNGKDLYFGELTVYPASGLTKDGAAEAIVFGAWIRQIGHSWFFRREPGLIMRLYRNALARHFAALPENAPAAPPA